MGTLRSHFASRLGRVLTFLSLAHPAGAPTPFQNARGGEDRRSGLELSRTFSRLGRQKRQEATRKIVFVLGARVPRLLSDLARGPGPGLFSHTLRVALPAPTGSVPARGGNLLYLSENEYLNIRIFNI